MSLTESLGRLLGNIKGEEIAGKRAKQAGKDYWGRIDSANWEPEYASQHAPAYQQTKSPVARAYLESFLTGNNADAVQGTRLGGTEQKAATTQNFNQAYGGWDKLQQQQNAELSDNARFQPTPITRPVRDDHKEQAARNPWASDYEKQIGRNLSNEEIARIGKWQTYAQMEPTGQYLKGLRSRTPQQLEAMLASGSDDFAEALRAQGGR